MRPRPGDPSPMTAGRRVIGLCMALGALWPAIASAQQALVPDSQETHAAAAGDRGYACVDPLDAMARRRFQDEPCRLPSYHLPPREAPKSSESPRRQTPAPASAATGGGHAMFWRFPVQGHGPLEVPRHSWR
jgi:hypothetical protein